MVHVAAAIVAHGGANGFGHFVDLRQEIFDREALKVGRGFERLVKIGDVSIVMLVVMDLHGLRANVRLEGVEGVWQRRQRMSHLGGCSLSRSGSHICLLISSSCAIIIRAWV